MPVTMHGTRGGPGRGISPVLRVNLLATVVGLLGGISAWLFVSMTDLVFLLFLELPVQALEGSCLASIAWLPFLVMPCAGGLVVGILVEKFSKEAKGHGVPEIIESLARRGGKMPTSLAPVKLLTASLTIGSGGSAGHEGPIAQVGAGFGSLVARAFKVDPEQAKTLVVAGVAAGISAIFNAPIGGALFSLEVVKRRTSMATIPSVIIASVVGAFVGQLLLGNQFALVFPPIRFDFPELLPLFVVLGLAAGGISAAWIKSFYAMESLQARLFARVRLPRQARPAAGGLLVGTILVIVYVLAPGTWPIFTTLNVSYAPINAIFAFNAGTGIMGPFIVACLLMIVVKGVATSLTIGSGGSGGVFMPTLYMGVLVGAIFGVLPELMLPGATSWVALFALLGMASFFAGTFRAPFTAVLLAAEITGDYFLAIPVMFAVITSVVVSYKLEHDDIYIKKLLQRGVNIEEQRVVDVLGTLTVAGVMVPVERVARVSTSDSCASVISRINTTGHGGFPVMEGDALVGIVSRGDLHGVAPDLLVRDLVARKPSRDVVAVVSSAPLSCVTSIMAVHGISRLPVVDETDGKKMLVGWITIRDVREAYASVQARAGNDEMARFVVVLRPPGPVP